MFDAHSIFKAIVGGAYSCCQLVEVEKGDVVGLRSPDPAWDEPSGLIFREPSGVDLPGAKRVDL